MLKKLAIIAFAVTAASISLAGQAKIREVVTSDYNRNSVSFVAVQRGDSYDSSVASAVKSFSPGQKFDINSIPTKTLRIRNPRGNSLNQNEVDEAVGATPFARELLGFIFNRDAQGMMDDKLVRYRGNYDAKDQDVINARASRIGEDALGDIGYALVKNSYVVLTDVFSMERHTDKEGKVSYFASARAYAYKIGLDDDTINDFYERCWIYDDDDAATRSAKLSAFQNLDIAMVPVAQASASGSSSTPEGAVRNCLPELVTGLENRIPAWEVAVGIVAVKPLRAKIGTKEGLYNGARYRSYSYTEDRNGNLKSVPRGYLRATEISSNTGMSIGETEPSQFYQISGAANIEEGWTIKQSNDFRIGAMLGYGGGLFNAFRINADWLVNVKTNGHMSYILADATMDFGSGDGVSSLYLALGYAYGIHLTRFLELAPYLMIGDDYMSPSKSYLDGYYSEDEATMKFLQRSGFVLEPGLRAVVNLAYPLQAYARVYYDLLLSAGINNDVYDTYDYYNYRYMGHHSNVGLQFGLKWTF